MVKLAALRYVDNPLVITAVLIKWNYFYFVSLFFPQNHIFQVLRGSVLEQLGRTNNSLVCSIAWMAAEFGLMTRIWPTKRIHGCSLPLLRGYVKLLMMSIYIPLNCKSVQRTSWNKLDWSRLNSLIKEQNKCVSVYICKYIFLYVIHVTYEEQTKIVIVFVTILLNL